MRSTANEWDPAPDFPFAIKLLHFSRRQEERPLAWHECLELFIPLGSQCRLRVGDSVLNLGRGDVLVMDNLKLHCVLDFPEPQLRAIVIRWQCSKPRVSGSIILRKMRLKKTLHLSLAFLCVPQESCVS